MTELYVRLSKSKFCSTLDRFWTRFSRTWDVLLHGNPAADVFSGLKLASGGELGFGVGEEDWGSGEREVLEDLTHRTEGLVDLVVSRFGEPASAIASDDAALPESEALPWMGSGNHPIASDGIVFGGVGAIARPSLRNISLWMRQIYTYGEYAYGVRDNPLRERRKRRRRNPPEPARDMNGGARAPRRSRELDANDLRQKVQQQEHAKMNSEEQHPIAPDVLPADRRPQIHGRTASQDHAARKPEHTPPQPAHDRPGIPPPIASAAEQALDRATQKADEDAEREGSKASDEQDNSPSTTMGIPDQYMKYLTFGLSELGRSSRAQRPPTPKRNSTGASSATLRPQSNRNTSSSTTRQSELAQHDDEDAPLLTHMDPMPDGETLKAKLAMQRRQENKGHFVVGLKGDLDALPEDGGGGGEEEASMTDGSFFNDSGGSRVVLRTLQIEVPPVTKPETSADDDDGDSFDDILQRKEHEASLDTANTLTRDIRKLRVLVYVHRPFMYCFLFESRTSSLAWSRFYSALHRNLLPIHKPLLSSTSVAKVAQRIELSHATESSSDEGEGGGGDRRSVRRSSAGTNRLPKEDGPGERERRPIFDLIYDPRLLTVHTSIPNIPDPGTLAAEGLLLTAGSGNGNGAGKPPPPPGWTRVEALNVHSQVLSTLQSVGGRGEESERTSKTSRGWWVVWMRVPPSAAAAQAGAGDAGSTVRGGGDSAATLHGGGEAGGMGRDEDESTGGVAGKQSEADSTATLHASDAYSRPATHDDNSAADAALRPLQQPQSARGGPDMHRTAFLVRKSSDSSALAAASKASSAGRGMASGMWSSLGLGSVLSTTMEEEKTGGASAGWGPGALAGGVGIDARRYVEGLLSLNR